MKITLDRSAGILMICLDRIQMDPDSTTPIDNVSLFLSASGSSFIGFRFNFTDPQASSWLRVWPEELLNFDDFLEQLGKHLQRVDDSTFLLGEEDKIDLEKMIRASAYVDFDHQGSITSIEISFDPRKLEFQSGSQNAR